MMKRLLLALLSLCLLATPSWAPASFSIYESGAWKSITVPYVGVSGTYKALANGWVYESGAWHLFFAAMSVSANDVTDNNSCGPSGGGRTCSYSWGGTSTAVVTGGSGSYSYLWTYVSGTHPDTATGTTTSALTVSTAASCPQMTTCTDSTTWNVHVTDTVTGATADAQATFFSVFQNLTG